jgi:hypothetical protein
MAHSSPLNLSGETWMTPRHTSRVDRANNTMPEIFAIAITEIGDFPASYPELPVPDALRQVFKSDGMQVVITFAKRTSLNSRLGSKPSSPGVQALVLPEVNANIASPA